MGENRYELLLKTLSIGTAIAHRTSRNRLDVFNGRTCSISLHVLFLSGKKWRPKCRSIQKYLTYVYVICGIKCWTWSKHYYFYAPPPFCIKEKIPFRLSGGRRRKGQQFFRKSHTAALPLHFTVADVSITLQTHPGTTCWPYAFTVKICNQTYFSDHLTLAYTK